MTVSINTAPISPLGHRMPSRHGDGVQRRIAGCKSEAAFQLPPDPHHATLLLFRHHYLYRKSHTSTTICTISEVSIGLQDPLLQRQYGITHRNSCPSFFCPFIPET
ncbi:MAG TPA: hypothetical protein VJM34_09360 [Novosphingobium sp.]|nr:hypothetical protein [Novosphingobium sp.]